MIPRHPPPSGEPPARAPWRTFDRELEAQREMAATQVARRPAVTLALGFLALVGFGLALELGGRGSLAVAQRLRRAPVGQAPNAAQDSLLGAAIRPAGQLLLLRLFGYGNRRVLVGGDAELYYFGDFDATVKARERDRAESPDSVAARRISTIVTLAREAARAGTGFVFLPVPSKLRIRPERFLGTPIVTGPALRCPPLEQIRAALEESGVAIFDPTVAMRELELSGEPAFLEGDSHWSPAGFDRVAEELARFIRSRHDLGPRLAMTRVEGTTEKRGELAAMLGLGESRHWSYLLYQPVRLQQTLWPDGTAYRSLRATGPVLLLGDSYSRQYFAHMQSVGDANFAEALAFHLGAAVTLRAENDAGADLASRAEAMRRELPGTRVVVLELAERSLRRELD